MTKIMFSLLLLSYFFFSLIFFKKSFILKPLIFNNHKLRIKFLNQLFFLWRINLLFFTWNFFILLSVSNLVLIFVNFGIIVLASPCIAASRICSPCSSKSSSSFLFNVVAEIILSRERQFWRIVISSIFSQNWSTSSADPVACRFFWFFFYGF